MNRSQSTSSPSTGNLRPFILGRSRSLSRLPEPVNIKGCLKPKALLEASSSDSSGNASVSKADVKPSQGITESKSVDFGTDQTLIIDNVRLPFYPGAPMELNKLDSERAEYRAFIKTMPQAVQPPPDPRWPCPGREVLTNPELGYLCAPLLPSEPQSDAEPEQTFDTNPEPESVTFTDASPPSLEVVDTAQGEALLVIEPLADNDSVVSQPLADGENTVKSEDVMDASILVEQSEETPVEEVLSESPTLDLSKLDESFSIDGAVCLGGALMTASPSFQDLSCAVESETSSLWSNVPPVTVDISSPDVPLLQKCPELARIFFRVTPPDELEDDMILPREPIVSLASSDFDLDECGLIRLVTANASAVDSSPAPTCTLDGVVPINPSQAVAVTQVFAPEIHKLSSPAIKDAKLAACDTPVLGNAGRLLGTIAMAAGTLLVIVGCMVLLAALNPGPYLFEFDLRATIVHEGTSPEALSSAVGIPDTAVCEDLPSNSVMKSPVTSDGSLGDVTPDLSEEYVPTDESFSLDSDELRGVGSDVESKNQGSVLDSPTETSIPRLGNISEAVIEEKELVDDGNGDDDTKTVSNRDIGVVHFQETGSFSFEHSDCDSPIAGGDQL